MGLASATVFLWVWAALRGFEVMEKENIFQKTPCPAFLMFDNAAYLADMSFELPCHCKPEQVPAVVWFHQKHLGSGHTQVLTDFDGRLLTEAAQVRAGSDVLTRFGIRMFSLLVFRAQPEDSGLYFCGTRRGDYFYAYDVDVQSSEGLLAAFQDRGQEPSADKQHGALRVFTAFWEWTPCDRCGMRGEQWRLGLCYLQSPDLPPRGFSWRILWSMWYSARVPVQFHQQRLGHGLILSCPGARPEHAVAWDKDRQPLYHTQYLKGTNRSMRVFIDHGHQLHIRFAQLSDRGTYYCWRQGAQVAGIRLAVTSRGRYPPSLSDPETRSALQLALLGYLLIMVVFISVHLCRCCCCLLRSCLDLDP
ncbi:Ig-like V-type domain-containing protein FAM187A [Fukomys damarensis]|uniref:Ig-like V-type domain-containing protein FAM187A n=1 Tax=Fukomys damarensis TaxID=885580 RepID=A0A091D2N9_FUKDA|nr:Ig-like V-type domain-containing protein FAM187A [Fukomys damarensis]